jgi:flagellar biosynthetic protein FliO
MIFTACLCAAQRTTDIGSFDISKVQQALSETTAKTVTDSVHPQHAAAAKKESNHLGWVIARISFYLAIIIVVIMALSWGIKRFGLAGKSKASGGTMDIIESLPLGQNRNIMLVRMSDKVYVIGQTPGRLSLIDTIEGEKAVELIASNKGGVTLTKFKDVFNSFIGKNKKV